jgi:hypothetical protein
MRKAPDRTAAKQVVEGQLFTPVPVYEASFLLLRSACILAAVPCSVKVFEQAKEGVCLFSNTAARKGMYGYPSLYC